MKRRLNKPPHTVQVFANRYNAIAIVVSRRLSGIFSAYIGRAVERIGEIALNVVMAFSIDLRKRNVAEANVNGARPGCISRRQSNRRS